MDGIIQDGVYLAGPIVFKDSLQRIVTGPVLVPNEADSDGETVTPEKIERVATKFMEVYGNIDVAHSFDNIATPVESWILRTAMKFQMDNGESLDLPKGTWMLSSKIRNDKVWQGIVDKKLRGYSVTAINLADFESAKKSKDITLNDFVGAAMKRRILLRDLKEDWVAAFVSIVEDPAVWKSKWVAIKNAGSKNPLERLFNRINIFKEEKIVIKEDNEMDEKTIKTAMKEAAVEAITEVVDEKVLPRLKLVEDKMNEKPPEEKPPTETKTEIKTEDSKDTEEKSESNVIDLSGQIGETQDELLKELQADEPDKAKIFKLNAKLETLREISKGNEEEKPKDIIDLQKEIDELKKKIFDEDPPKATKSRANTGQDGGWDKVDKDADDDLPKRDAHGCVMKKRK